MPSRRELLARIGKAAVGSVALLSASTQASAQSREVPEDVTISDDAELVDRYRPRLVIEGVEPQPLAYYGLHAELDGSTLNAVYGFTEYPYQDGKTSYDSHLGDHEPVIVWYDQSTGETVRVDYAGFHWFRATATEGALQFAENGRQPILRVDPSYHHYYLYQGDAAGRDIERRSLVDAIDGWLSNGMDEDLALSQPYDPWKMLGRSTWWRHTTGNWLNASLHAIWFNLGLSGANATSDLEEVGTW